MNPEELLKVWRRRSRRIQSAHYDSASRLEQLHYWIGLPAIAMTTLVGTSMFATLQENPRESIKLLVGFASVAAAILTAMQTFLQYAERAEKHKRAGVKYGALKRETEEQLAFPLTDQVKLAAFVNDLRTRWDKLVEESPTIPKVVWRKYEHEDDQNAHGARS